MYLIQLERLIILDEDRLNCYFKILCTYYTLNSMLPKMDPLLVKILIRIKKIFPGKVIVELEGLMLTREP